MLTPQQAAAIKTAYSKHQETQRCALALKHQLERIHQEQIMIPLADAIQSEGSYLGALLDLAKGVQPNPPDPADIEDQAETTREIHDEWSRGR